MEYRDVVALLTWDSFSSSSTIRLFMASSSNDDGLLDLSTSGVVALLGAVDAVPMAKAAFV